MKRLSDKWWALFFLLAMGGIGLMAKPIPKAVKQAKQTKTIAKQKHDEALYWYDTNDNYVEANTVDLEEGTLMNEYDVWVDDNSPGGTLLEKGYQLPGKPHMGAVMVFLYGHF